MGKHLGITEPDECIMLFVRQILQRAKEDRVSMGIYDDTNNNNNQHIDETKVCMSKCFFLSLMYLNETFQRTKTFLYMSIF
jgi:hypothetical protein